VHPLVLSRRSHSHLIISLPELLLTSMCVTDLLVLQANADSYQRRALVADVEDEATALAILSNAFLSLAETTSLDEIHRGLECLAQLTSAARPIPGHAGPSPSARSELTDGICSELKQLLRIVASNDGASATLPHPPPSLLLTDQRHLQTSTTHGPSAGLALLWALLRPTTRA
jgi:hypothetical protein